MNLRNITAIGLLPLLSSCSTRLEEIPKANTHVIPSPAPQALAQPVSNLNDKDTKTLEEVQRYIDILINSGFIRIDQVEDLKKELKLGEVLVKPEEHSPSATGLQTLEKMSKDVFESPGALQEQLKRLLPQQAHPLRPRSIPRHLRDIRDEKNLHRAIA